ncbi:multicopper oxidase domain-containing protein [Adonisia turfae]|nr:multicopper oxidase domain-containing protein [Adonisia turfae]
MTLFSVGIFCLCLNSPAWATTESSPSSQYYKQPLTAPAQIQTKLGETGIEATISVDYNIPNNAGYKPGHSSLNPRSTIGPDVVSLRNYTILDVAQGEFTVANLKSKIPILNNKKTWVTDLIGPTLRVKPGDTITLHLINNLPDDREAGYKQWLDQGYRQISKNHPEITFNEYRQYHTRQDYFDEGNVSCIGNGLVSNASCNMTNFHTHGLHDSPMTVPKMKAELAAIGQAPDTIPEELKYWIGDDVIDSLLPGGNQWDIKIKVPQEHPAGTFWYHPHQHGTTSVDLASGLEGAIIIDDIGPEIPNFNPDQMEKNDGKKVKSLDAILADAGIHDRLLMFQHLPYEAPDGKSACITTTPCEVGWAENGAQDANFAGQTFTGYTLVNGQTYPLIEMAAGEIERWRLINGGVAEPLSLSIVQLSTKGIGSLTGTLDALVAPNRLPFLTNTNTNQVVIGTGATTADTWLADTRNFTPRQEDTGISSLPLNIIAYDGITTGQIERHTTCPGISGSSYANCVTMGPGNRVDGLVQFPTQGTYLVLKSPNYKYLSNAVAASTEDIAAIITVQGRNTDQVLPPESELLAYANYQYYPPAPKMATVSPTAKYEGHFIFFPAAKTGPAPTHPDETRYINNITFGFAFSCTDESRDKNKWCMATDFSSASELEFDTPEKGLDYEIFTEDMRPIVLTKEALGEWTLKVDDNGTIQSAHPFHIHTNPFYLKEIKTCEKAVTTIKTLKNTAATYQNTYADCTSTTPNRWQDTLLVQPNQISTFRYQPLDYEGSFVFHCHFVDHEDNGMMRWVKVCGKDNTQCIEQEKYGLFPDFTPDDL